MARKTKEERLTLDQIGNIRATQARRAGQLLRRLGTYANGDLDKDGNPIAVMDSNQVKAALGLIGHILPAQQSTTFQDVTEPEKTREDIEGNVQQELMKALKMIPKEQRQALIDSVDQVKQ